MMVDIKGYEGLYSVTPEGKIWSHPRLVNNRGRMVPWAGRWLVLCKKTGGYEVFRPTVNGKGRTVNVHRVVAETFIPNPENLPFINHIDCNPSNNNVSNLEWCTQKQNMQHMVKMGRAVSNKGTRNGNSKLTELDVLLIRAMCELGEMKSEIADWFGIERYFVHRINNRQNWAHI